MLNHQILAFHNFPVAIESLHRRNQYVGSIYKPTSPITTAYNQNQNIGAVCFQPPICPWHSYTLSEYFKAVRYKSKCEQKNIGQRIHLDSEIYHSKIHLSGFLFYLLNILNSMQSESAFFPVGDCSTHKYQFFSFSFFFLFCS